MPNKSTQAEIILAKITSSVDRHATILNNREVSTVKLLIRVKDGIVQEVELSVDLKRAGH